MTPPSISMRLLEGEPRPALDGWLRRRLLQRLAPLRHGALQLDDARGSQRLGAPAEAAPVPAPTPPVALAAVPAPAPRPIQAIAPPPSKLLNPNLITRTQ